MVAELRHRIRRKFDQGLEAVWRGVAFVIALGIVAIPVVVVAYPFWDAYYERRISGSDWQALGGVGGVRTASWTTYDILGATPTFRLDFTPRHYFVADFDNKSEYIIRRVQIDLKVRDKFTGEMIYSLSAPCVRESEFAVEPGQAVKDACGFPLPLAVSEFLERGGEAENSWAYSAYGTRKPLRIVAIVALWFAKGEDSISEWYDWITSLFERV